MMMMMLLRFFTATLALALVANAMTDKATGITFPKTRNDLDIFGVGVRKKGPIKIYSVACYCHSALKEKLASISRGNAKQDALKALQSGAKEGPTNFLLEMSFKVGAEKMASAIADSVAPRHGGSAGDIDDLKGLILGGVSTNCKGGAAVKGTQLEFSCSPEDGVDVAVNGQTQGNVASPDLAKAFCDVYLDNKCVSPALVQSCLENNCAP